jgi:phage tail-like protein
MPGSEYTATWLVKVGGSPLPADVDVLLNTAWVDQNQQLPDLFVLRFRDPDRIITTKGGMAIGATVTVQVVQPDSGTPQTLMTGEVTALEVELDAEGTFTIVRGYDLTHRLRHGSRVTTYLNQSYDQIVRKVLQGANLAPGTIERTSTVHTHVGQANVDDLSVPLRRDLVARAVELHARRGTAAGLAALVELVTGTAPEIVESGGTSWSAEPRSEPPGDGMPGIVVRVRGDEVEQRVVEAVVTAASPAHVPHRVEVVPVGQGGQP